MQQHLYNEAIWNKDKQKYLPRSFTWPNITNGVCKIVCPGGTGSGFFIKISFNNEVRYGLMTNNHVIDEQYLSTSNPVSCKLSIDGTVHSFEIPTIFNETKADILDFTFIDIIDRIRRKIEKVGGVFLTHVDDKYEVNIGDELFIPQYPGGWLREARGRIIDLDKTDIAYDVATEPGSSGSPVVNEYGVVVGLHKAGWETRQKNIGTHITNVVAAIFAPAARKRWMLTRRMTIGQLDVIIAELKKHDRNTRISNTVGNGVSIAGAVVSFIGIIFWPLLPAGISIAAAGSAVSIGSRITQGAIEKHFTTNAKQIIEADQKASESFYKSVLNLAAGSFQTGSAIFRVGSNGLKIVALSTKLVVASTILGAVGIGLSVADIVLTWISGNCTIIAMERDTDMLRNELRYVESKSVDALAEDIRRAACSTS